MIKQDKRKFSICIVRHSEKDNHFKWFDNKNLNHNDFTRTFGLDKALKEAQRLANKYNKKVVVLQSEYNVYPNKKESNEV